LGNDYSVTLLTTVLCVPGIYGPRDTDITPNILKMPTRLQLGPSNALHCYIYVKNAAHAYFLATNALLSSELPNKPDTKVDGELFFLSDDEPIGFWQFARKLKFEAGDQVAGDPSKVIVLPWVIVLTIALISEWAVWLFSFGRATPRLNRFIVRFIRDGGYFDITKAKERLRYRPLVNMDEGIKETVKWFQKV